MRKNVNPALTGALFGLLIAVLCFVSQLYGGIAELNTTLLTAIGTGAAAGLLFGFYIRSFTKRQAAVFKDMKNRLEESGKVLYDAAANHEYNDEPVGGWLFLTESELIFMANPMNVLSHKVRISLSDIESAEILKQMGFKSGIKIVAANKTESFSVTKPDKWLEIITKETTQ